ncbi:family 43 glycosylhydrolase [Paenibacillus lycopersici]|uniref:Family 43 glycosylhydrolase n=1 Tax=Paenibacillus lycopersici TaxID=2704462 RepID=A0A6C0G4L3_9BACL|nr:glycoside hydrolase family 130 protein [Paenibacillus lycopersici]QHT62369.1 family 43 glycosylhydrolase [Paenibacillus lycopersici]
MTNTTQVRQWQSWELGPFVKADAANPCLEPDAERRFACPVRGEVVQWEEKDVFNPAAVVRDGRVCLLYRAEDIVGRYAGTSRIGLAESEDGLRFAKRPEPVLYPNHDAFEGIEWEGGCEDPRIVEDENGVYYLIYTSYDGAKARLCIASSPDLVDWTKHGRAFGEFADIWSKAAAVVTRREGERFIAAKINGKYWMYWGESNIYAATSDDLIRWSPVVSQDFRGYDAEASLVPIMLTRRNCFDSTLVEPGPQAVLTEHGIRLIYNGRNDERQGDPAYAPGAYCSGQALFDVRDPMALIGRSTTPFLVPDKDYEISGQVNHVCFVEGLVYYRNQWLLYYGTADSKIAVAVCNEGSPRM